MKICFHLDNLSLRGTTTAILDYAHYNQTILNNESIIAYDEVLLSDDRDQNFSKRFEIADSFKRDFDTIKYKTKEDLKLELDNRDCDHIYFLKSGFVDHNYVEGKKNLIHCVFNFYQPHGHRYAYVSDWLSESASGGKCQAVPHIVSLPDTKNLDLRSKLNISKDKIVIGRYGGFEQFDIRFVHEIINFVVNSDPCFVFVFVNTKKFIEHPNVIFLDPIIEKNEKSDFILSCDAMIHARSDGESFGLSICEFLFLNKPVISFGGGRDKNNVRLLQDCGLIYNNQYELLQSIFKLKYNMFNLNYSDIVAKFSPQVVMKKFEEVFLNE